jgi:hypothetical protein
MQKETGHKFSEGTMLILLEILSDMEDDIIRQLIRGELFFKIDLDFWL